jgi:N-acetylneuraminic acid mutarotase
MRTAFRLLMLSLLIISAAASVMAQTPEITHNTWTSGAPLPTPVVAPAVGVLKDEIYLVGGETADGTFIADTQIYNPATNTWSTGVPLPTPICCDAAGAVVKSVLYVIGGSSDGVTCTNAVWAYSPKTKTWSAKAAMPTARCSVAAVEDKNIIYVIGGNGNNGMDRLNTVESYNPATDTWTEEAPLLVGKSEPTVGLVGKTIVAADGYTASEDTGDNEGYDVITNTWTSLKADPSPRNTACGGGIGAYMYVAGGYPGGNPGTPALSLTESFKVSKNTWTTLAPMPQAAMLSGSAVYKKQLYCIGGSSSFQGTVLNNVQIYQP